MYILPEYIQSTIKRSYQVNETISSSSYNEDSNHSSINDKVQQESARWSMYLSLATIIPAIFTNLVMGSYSDVIGRKKLLVICLSGTLNKITMVMVTIKTKLDFYFFIFGNLIEGLTGACSTLLAVSFSYISDLKSRERAYVIHCSTGTRVVVVIHSIVCCCWIFYKSDRFLLFVCGRDGYVICLCSHSSRGASRDSSP